MSVSPADVARVMMEQQHIAERQTHRDHRTHADEWALSHGIELGTMAMICNGIIAAFEETVLDLSRQELGDDPSTEFIDGAEYVQSPPSAFNSALEMTILSAWRWGYETARQIR